MYMLYNTKWAYKLFLPKNLIKGNWFLSINMIWYYIRTSPQNRRYAASFKEFSKSLVKLQEISAACWYFCNRVPTYDITYWAVWWFEIFWLRGTNLGSKLHPGGVKNSHQDQFNEGSNFSLSSLKVSHWVVQTQPFFDKLPEITDFGLLQQSQNRARFWIC